MLRSSGCLTILTLTLVQALPAQGTRASGSGDTHQVRMELASVLLQSKRYLEAAGEYRTILARSPYNFAARLGLARALAWSRQQRAAETELRILRGQQPRNRDVQVLLRSVRQSLEPAAREALLWLREDPNHVPYRRALARALMREGNAREAVRHYERLISLDLSTPLVVETTQAYLETKQYERSAVLLNRVLQRRPHEARLLLARAQVNLARRDLRAAEADAIASLRLAPTPDAYLLLGDVRRWRADYNNARTVYNYAHRMRPSSPDVRTASAQLRRDERPIPAFVRTANLGDAWRLRSTAVSDNAGVVYTTAGARREIETRSGTTASVEVELRYLQEQSASIEDEVTGAAFTAGVAHEFAHGAWLMQLQGRGGLVHHFEASLFTVGFSAAGWYGPWALSLEYARGPAYPTLLTTAAMAAPDEAPLRESSFTGALGGPLGGVDVALSAQHAAFSDANQRITLQGMLRFPVNHHVALLGSATGVWFARASELYWAPQTYVAAAAGLELAKRKPLGFSIALRGLAGPARSVEDEEHSSIQYSAGIDFGYRGLARDVGVTLTYGTGRGGGYSRFDAGVYVNLLH